MHNSAQGEILFKVIDTINTIQYRAKQQISAIVS